MNGASKLESSSPIGGIVVTPRALAQWRQDAADANDNVQAAMTELARPGTLPIGQTTEGVLREAMDLTARIQKSTRVAMGIHAPAPTFTGEIDLMQFDTPDTRELLALLERAQAVAERIDAARGRAVDASVPLGPGESRGTDLAETISMVALRVRGEVHGASGGGLE